MGIREAYSGLFATYDDASRKDDEALRDFFTSTTDVGEAAVSHMVGTFKALCELTDFGAPVGEARVVGKTSVPGAGAEPATPVSQGVNIHINVQLTLPATKDSSIYDSLFESLKKHLLPS